MSATVSPRALADFVYLSGEIGIGGAGVLELVDLVQSGDRPAADAVARAGWALGVALAELSAVLADQAPWLP